MEPGLLDDQLSGEYLAECREHLANIEADLLAIEQRGAEIDEQLVNRVFRAAHSIKGGAGFFGLVVIRDLAHKTENVLDLVRSRLMIPTAEAINILLAAFDRLRELISNHLSSNSENVSEISEALTNLAAGGLPAVEATTLHERVSVSAPGGRNFVELSAFDWNQAHRGGKSVYLIQYDLIHDVQRRGKTPLEVLRMLMQCGVVMDTAFDLDSIGTLDNEPANTLLFEVLYASVIERDLIGQLVSLRPDQIRVVTKNGSVESLAAEVHEARQPAPSPAIAPLAPALPAADAKVHQTESGPGTEATIRLGVGLLDSLMTLAGELVLSRNELNEAVARQDTRAIRASTQRLSAVSSELQETVMLTRMQPVSAVFAKVPRQVRDLTRELGKKVRLETAGGEVEIDKSILEGLADPLTHMVRNAVDHGIESPAERLRAGKPGEGTLTLKASHQAGQVVLEIADDGNGIDAGRVAAAALAKGLITEQQLQGMTEADKLNLIFLPGLSTAKAVTGVSGRGVGMDVVRTNLERLGGQFEIDSKPGRGTSFRIRLPLTLAIIPSLVISAGGRRFAIPQVNVGELIRIPADQIPQRTDRIGDAEVLILREKLVPLFDLAETLGGRRMERAGRAINVVLVSAGDLEYGFVVEELHDTVEIVVKPLGRHLAGLREYAGATVLGDGRVALILDAMRLGAKAGVSAVQEALSRQSAAEGPVQSGRERHSFLLFHNAPDEPCAIPLGLVNRIERIRYEQIEHLGGKRTVQHRGASMPLLALNDTAAAGEVAADQHLVVIVFERGGRPLGLLAAEPLDMLVTDADIDTVTLRQPGVSGSAILKGRTTLLVDVLEIAARMQGESAAAEAASTPCLSTPTGASSILVAEDSDFFRGQLKRFLEGVGYPVMTAADGQEAWELLEQNADRVALLATDVEMPRLDGLSLTRRLRADARFAELPVIALTSLAGEEDTARGLAAGVDEYQVKLNQEELLAGISRAFEKAARGRN